MSFSLKSETTLPILLMVVLVAVILGTRAAFPYNAVYQYVAGGFSILFIVALIPILGIQASKLGNEYLHVLHTVRIWSSMYPIQRDYFIENVDLKDMVLGQGILAGLRWFIYLIPTRPVDLTDRIGNLDMGDCSWHIWFLPDPWDDFFKFRKREFGAYILSQVFTHHASECATSYLSPLTYDPPGLRLPMNFFVEASGTGIVATREWRDVMEQVAGLDMVTYIKEHKEEITRMMERIHNSERQLTPKEQEEGLIVVKR